MATEHRFRVIETYGDRSRPRIISALNIWLNQTSL